MIKLGKISERDEILIVEEKRLPLIGNRTKRSLEMNPKQRELEEMWLKESNMRTKRKI